MVCLLAANHMFNCSLRSMGALECGCENVVVDGACLQADVRAAN